MFAPFTLGEDGLYRCDAFGEFVSQKHGFGTRHANPTAKITLRQVHSNVVLNAAGLEDRAREGDGLVTDTPGETIGVRTADCVPLLLFDRQRKAVGAVHAGWRGSAAEVVKHAVTRMAADFKSATGDLYVAIGPCIRECCYQVGADVFARFLRWFPERNVDASGPQNLNLAEANRRQLLESGVSPGHIFDSGLCTVCFPDQFVSYRREPQNPWRMISSISRVP